MGKLGAPCVPAPFLSTAEVRHPADTALDVKRRNKTAEVLRFILSARGHILKTVNPSPRRK